MDYGQIDRQMTYSNGNLHGFKYYAAYFGQSKQFIL